MAHFYGILKGNRGQATRLGSAKSGLTTTAASWQGAVSVELWKEEDGIDFVRVEIIPWKGKGDHKMLYLGPVGSERGKK